MEDKRKRTGMLFVLPSLLGVSVLYIYPFFLSITYCFTRGIGSRQFVGLRNFFDLFNNEAYILAFKNTVFITVIALPLLCILSLAISLLIEKEIQKYANVQTLLLIPLFLPAASIILVWQHIFEKEGILNLLLNLNIDWLASSYSRWIVIGMIIWKNLGYNIILMVSVLLDMPKEYEEAANLDGAGFLGVCRYIKIPLIMPMFFFLTIISLNNSFKIFKEIYLLQGNYPYKDLYLIQHFMNNNFSDLNYEMLATAAISLYIIIYIAIYTIGWLQRKYDYNNI